MDKEEFKIKLEEINNLVEKKEYKGAMKIVDSIDWRRVKSVRTLCVVGEIYAANKRYEDSKEILLLAYHRSPIGKNVLYRLIEIAIKMGDLDEALEYYTEFVEVAPNDNTRYVLKYKIYNARKAPIEEQIEILEDYKEREYTERWSYELAKLYFRSGNTEKCVETCDDLILWFSEGKYVQKALELKKRIQPLSPSQERIYENQLRKVEEARLQPSDVQKEKAPEQEEEVKNAAEPVSDVSTEDIISEAADFDNQQGPVIGSIKIDKEEEEPAGGMSSVVTPILETTEALQEKIAKGFKDIFSGKKKSPDEFYEEEAAAAQEELAEDEEEQELMPSSEEMQDAPRLEPETKAPNEINISETVKVVKPKPFKMPEPIAVPTARVTEEQKQSQDPAQDMAKTQEFDFNLEDSILAAATAQGIPVPLDEEEKQRVMDMEEAAATAQLEEPTAVFQEEQEAQPEDETETEADVEFAEPEEEIVRVSIDDGDSSPEEYEDVEEIPEDQEEPIEAEQAAAGETEEEQESLEEIREAIEEPLQEFIEEDPFQESVETEPEAPDEIQEFLEEYEPSEEPEESQEFEIPSLEPETIISEAEVLQRRLMEEDTESVEESPAAQEPEEYEEDKPVSEEEELEMIIASRNPEPEVDPMDIVPREKKLDDDEKKLFTYFATIPGMKEQIADALADAQLAAADKTSKVGNIIIMGSPESGKTRLSEGMVRAICRELHLEAAKKATVYSDQINGKNLAEVVNKLAGGFLIIERASQLKPDSIEELNRAMEFRTDGLTVILEDEKIGMRKMIAKYPKFAAKFTSIISVPVFTNDELVTFARTYAKEMGYKMDELGVLALYNLIGNNQREDEPMTIGVVKDMVDDAIDKADSATRKLKRNLSGKRTDEDGRVILYEKDFK